MKQFSNNYLKFHGKPMRRKALYKCLKSLKSRVIVGTWSSGKSFAEKLEKYAEGKGL